MSSGSNTSKKRLGNESSPYLLQHANNPVDWFPFGDEAFEKARRENKPLLISIGYSACHWCHVMEHESFESEQVAAVMNAGFINVKVDREERSDVDHLYMQAVQLMTGHGGWPLNCFVMPDGSPFYGGTYFPKEQWLNVLQNISKLWNEEQERVQEYAKKLTDGIHQTERLLTNDKEALPITKEHLQESVQKWKTRMDTVEGGPNRAPKFPLPSNYLFLLRYAQHQNDEELLAHVHLTLQKMANGGIYDQLHGGFCRYSTDVIWKVPHFEKMLYDNAQLAALYTEAYRSTGHFLYAQVAKGILDFVAREWFNNKGYFYSAYDADSDGEEGKYYVWKDIDLKEILGNDYDLFSKYYLINDRSYWEHGNYILMRNENQAQLLTETGLTRNELESKVEIAREKLRQEAKSRLKPGLDDKMITAWNAMMCSAYAQGALVFDEPRYKDLALKSAEFLRTKITSSTFELSRTYKNGIARIPAFLEDYAFTAAAWMDVYVLQGNEKWLLDARRLTEYALQAFKNAGSEMLYYTASNAAELVTRTTEISDNVCPASNSQMAHNLFRLAKYFDMPQWEQKAHAMTALVTDELRAYGSGYSHWATLALQFLFPFKEVAIVGNNVDELLPALAKAAPTNTIFAISRGHSDLPLVKGRYVEDKTMIYVCENRACKLPVNTVEAALEQLA